MFEFIGIVVVAWIGFAVLRGVFRASSTVRSQEYGKEAKYIAINELGVPLKYYHHAVINDMDRVKEAALVLKEQSENHKDFSWPRLLAWTIYAGFRNDCEQYQRGNPISQQKLEDMMISPDQIFGELNRDPSDLL